MIFRFDRRKATESRSARLKWRHEVNCMTLQRCDAIQNITHTESGYAFTTPHDAIFIPTLNYNHMLVAAESSVVYITNTITRRKHFVDVLCLRNIKTSALAFVVLVRVLLAFFHPESRRWKRSKIGKKHFSNPTFPLAEARRNEDENWEGFLLTRKKKWKKSLKSFRDLWKKRNERRGCERTYMKGTKGDVILFVCLIMSPSQIFIA